MYVLYCVFMCIVYVGLDQNKIIKCLSLDWLIIVLWGKEKEEEIDREREK